MDADFIKSVTTAAVNAIHVDGYDSEDFTLTLNFPVSLIIRDEMIRFLNNNGNRFSGILSNVPLKMRIVDAYLPSLRDALHMRSTLNSSLSINVTFIHDEFNSSEFSFFCENYPNEFCQSLSSSKKRRKYDTDEDISTIYTKVRVMNVIRQLQPAIVNRYQFGVASRKCTFTVTIEHEPVFIAGRYCKYSRCLPQSPWAADERPRIDGNSVSEIVCNSLKTSVIAQSSRFSALGLLDLYNSL
jgi:tRNA pseudouridine synthase 10